MHVAKWPDRETERKNWITEHRNNRGFVSTRSVTHDFADVAGTSWCYGFIAGTVTQKNTVESFKKCAVSNDLDGTV
jgi:hypothetical protein